MAETEKPAGLGTVAPEGGWRDDPYVGKDQCRTCFGWGTYGTHIPPVGGKFVELTCRDCLGTGHTPTV